MEPQGSLPCSKNPSAGYYSKVVNSVYTLIPSLCLNNIHFNIIFYIHPSVLWVLPAKLVCTFHIPMHDTYRVSQILRDINAALGLKL
jgi:hypothetical protein